MTTRRSMLAPPVGAAVAAAELPMRVEFVLNREAAKSLGITIPRAVELRADWVIT